MTTKSHSYFEKLEKKYGRLTFGLMLKSWRESEEFGQAEFSKRLGISPQNLNDIEKGRRIPSPTRASKIAKKLGIPALPLIQLAIRDTLYKEGFEFDVFLKAS